MGRSVAKLPPTWYGCFPQLQYRCRGSAAAAMSWKQARWVQPWKLAPAGKNVTLLWAIRNPAIWVGQKCPPPKERGNKNSPGPLPRGSLRGKGLAALRGIHIGIVAWGLPYLAKAWD